MSNPWFGRNGIAQLAAQQMRSVGGRSAVTNTCLAAYKQFDDIEVLVQLLDSSLEHLDPTQRETFDKIYVRHEKYRAAMENEVIP